MRCALVVMMGCGTSHTPQSVDETAAKGMVEQLGKVAAAMDASDGNAGLLAAFATLHDADGVFLTVTPSLAALQLDASAQVSATCAPDRCSLSYGRSVYPFGDGFNATVTRDGDVVTFDLGSHTSHNAQARSVESVTASVTITSSRIAGSWHRKLDNTLFAASTGDLTIDLRGIALDATGCPMAGSLHAIEVLDVHDQPSDSHDYEGTLTFSSCP